MQISSRFTIALHVCVCIEIFKDDYKVTGDFLAKSINTNPVIVRNILLQLRNAGLITPTPGKGGYSLAKDPIKITFLDVYNAVESVNHGELFHFHENPNPDCPVGRNIHKILDNRLNNAQKAMEDELSAMTLQDIINDADKFITLEENM